MSTPQSVCLPHVSQAATAQWMQVVSHIDPSYGGLSTVVPVLGEKIASRGNVGTSIAAFCSPGEEFRPFGYESERISFWPAARVPWLRDRALLERFRAAVGDSTGLHLHGLWEQSTALAARTARALGRPYIISAHGMLEPWALQNKRLKKMLYAMLVEHRNVERAACLHALTRAEADHFVRFGARTPIAIIPNGVEIPANLDPEPFFEQHPELRGKRIILFLARLHPKKGLWLLLEAWRRIARSSRDAHLVIAGPDSGDMLASLNAFVTEHSLASSVSFTGMLQAGSKWPAMAASECFILPSFSEGLSVSVLEALGAGLPAIVTVPCNMPEIAEHRAGWQIEPNVEEITQSLGEALANSPAKNQKIGQNGARLVATRYAWNTIARQMEDVYRWVQGGEIPRDVELIFP